MQIEQMCKPRWGILKNKPKGLSEGWVGDIIYLFISSPGGLDSFILFHVCCFAASQSPVCSLNFLRVADEKEGVFN